VVVGFFLIALNSSLLNCVFFGKLNQCPFLLCLDTSTSGRTPTFMSHTPWDLFHSLGRPTNNLLNFLSGFVYCLRYVTQGKV